MALHPLFHRISLKTATQAVAIIHLVVFFMFIVVGIIMARLEGIQIQRDKQSFGVSEIAITSECLRIAIIIAGAIGMLLSLLLLQGVTTKNVYKIRAFLIMMLSGILSSIMEMTKGPSSIFPQILAIVLMTYCAWIVESFAREVQLEQRSI